MRPVLLELDGFASFREPTVVDFRDADYFALVGPTGSGKSTVIDALTFALYGSVPRWDNPRTVALALAPTVGRGVVRFVFDVGGGPAHQVSGGPARGRYVAVREVRRAASGSVSVRSARLERLRDQAGTGAPEEETDPLAEGAAATTRAVEDLLGLPFSDFTTCVVLPQGEFAEFLHTEPRKRQETLVRLLGLGVYDVLAKEANTEAKVAEQRAQVLTEQLGGFADATAEAEQATAARVEELTRLRGRVEDAGTALDAVDEALAEIGAVVAALDGEERLLSDLAPPPGLAALTARHGDAAAATARTAAAVAAAEAADTAAHEAFDAGPPRAPLEQAAREHAERAAVDAALPDARQRHVDARAAEMLAAHAGGVARESVEAARDVLGAATARLTEVRATAARLSAERDLLLGVTPPAGLDALDDRVAATAAAFAGASDAVERAEKVDEAARTALAAAPRRVPLEQARRDHRELVGAQAELAAASTAAGRARDAVATASAGVSDTRAHLDHAGDRRAASARRDLVAAMRPVLAVGDACPVCAQRVAVLPEPLPAGDLAAADRALAAADAAHDAARLGDAAARAELGRADHAVQTTRRTVERLTRALAAVAPDVVVGAVVPGAVVPGAVVPGAVVPGAVIPEAGIPRAAIPGSAVPGDRIVGAEPGTDSGRPGGPAGRVGSPGQDADVVSAAAIAAALERLDALDAAARAADSAARHARAIREATGREADAARRETAAAAATLVAARDPLVPLGAPAAADHSGIAAAWAALMTWAADTAATRSASLLTAGAAADRAAAAHAGAQAAFAAAELTADRRRRDETAAARLGQDAAGAADRLERRVAELDVALRDAPVPAAVTAELARIAELEDAARAAGVGARAARAALRDAERSAAAVDRELAAMWDGVRAARDPLVALGAPVPPGDDIETAWAGLARWATVEAGDRSTRVAVARSTAAEHAAQRAGLVARTVADLADHGITAPGTSRPGSVGDAVPPAGLAPGGPGAGLAAAPAVVAAAVERARAARERIVERRAAAAALLADRDRALEAQRVARMLGQLLRSDGFPRWLVASALDALVADASLSLAELSGGQFELTHDGGEFLVVDHADADTRRPVKTLSGGETFQASLALALALSAQVTGLAVHGAARLESIFLDEGFGTLDAANLETVASTLETLAARGDRVVGVVTHVPALAERVPVRYVVRRDQRSSSVTREDL